MWHKISPMTSSFATGSWRIIQNCLTAGHLEVVAGNGGVFWISKYVLRGHKLNQVIIISAKWTKWITDIMCSFNVCLSVFLFVRSGTVNQTSLKRELNANSLKMVKATDFKFDVRFPRDSPNTNP